MMPAAGACMGLCGRGLLASLLGTDEMHRPTATWQGGSLILYTASHQLAYGFGTNDNSLVLSGAMYGFSFFNLIQL